MRYLPAILCLCFMPSQPSPDVASTIEDAMPSVVVIQATKQGNWGKRDVISAGVVVGKNRIVTCSHCVNDASAVVVKTRGGRELKATVKVNDASRELALLVVEANDLRPMPMTEKVPAPGLPVAAIGHPCGFQWSASTGIVSATGRKIDMPGGVGLKNIVQTTTPINPGNSGGPLLNDAGEMFALCVAVREGAQGIGFAIPASAVRKFVADHP